MRSVNIGLVAAALLLGTTALTTPAFATGNHNNDNDQDHTCQGGHNCNGGDTITNNYDNDTYNNTNKAYGGDVDNKNYNDSHNTANGGAGGQGGQGGQGGNAQGGAGGNATGGAGGNATGGNAINSNKNEANNTNINAPVAHGGQGGEGGKGYGGNATGGNATGGNATGGSATGGTSNANNNGNGNGNGNGNNNGNLKDVGNVTDSANNHNYNTDINNNKNEQDQDQKQKQKQQQQQKQEIKNSGNSEIKNSGNSYNKNDNSNSNNAQQEVNVDASTHNERAPVNTAYAAPLVSGEDTCMGSSSIGAQAVSFGLSIGTTWQDDNCRRLKNSRQMVSLGYHRAATALMCVDKDVEEAMTRAGTPCPGSQAAAAQVAYYQPAPIVREYAQMAPIADQPVKKHRARSPKLRKSLPPK